MTINPDHIPACKGVCHSKEKQIHFPGHPPSEVLLKIVFADQHDTLDFQTY